VSESRTYFESYPVSPRDRNQRLGDRCAIGFWNLTSGRLSLRVDGVTRTILPGKSAVVETGRQFTWQVEGREIHREAIPMGEAGLDIVIRR
jgi:hypothetical protein